MDGNRDETINAFARVRLASEKQLALRYLDFDQIRFISPSAALLLASEVDRWNESRGHRLKARVANWHPPIRRLLCEMGLFELLNLERPAEDQQVLNTKFLPFIRGNVDERTDAGQTSKDLRLQIESVMGIKIKKYLLSDGITEAATNVSHHAYRRRGRRKKRYKPWWVFAAVGGDTNLVTVCFYDHGRTIPGTLPESESFKRWKFRIRAWNDGMRIRAAMTVGRSATGKSGRGKGMANLLELISEHKDSRLRIFSRSGLLVVTNSNGAELDYRSEHLELPLKGTLIEWQFVPNTASTE